MAASGVPKAARAVVTKVKAATVVASVKATAISSSSSRAAAAAASGRCPLGATFRLATSRGQC